MKPNFSNNVTESELKPKYDILLYVVLIVLLSEIKKRTNNKITSFGFYFDWKSTYELDTTLEYSIKKSMPHNRPSIKIASFSFTGRDMVRYYPIPIG